MILFIIQLCKQYSAHHEIALFTEITINKIKQTVKCAEDFNNSFN